MSKTMNISLSICGNPDSGLGYQELVSIEQVFTPADKSYAGVMMNESFYTLQILPEYTTIIKTITNVCSFGAGREGRMRIGISIPRGMMVSNPFALVNEIETVFKSNYMIQGRTMWQFNKIAAYNADLFAAVIQRYGLIPSPMPHRPMSLNGTVGYVFTSMIEALLKDFQYREFSTYSEIVIAQQGTVSQNVISSLTIPREPVYTVHVVKPDGQTEELEPITNPGKINQIPIAPANSNVNDPVIAIFSIDELMNAHSGDKDFEWGRISLDQNQEAVKIIVNSFAEKTFNCRIIAVGDSLDLSEVALVSGNTILQLPSSGNLAIKGELINRNWSVQTNNSDYRISPGIIHFSPASLSAQVTISKKVQPKPNIPIVNSTSVERESTGVELTIKAKYYNPKTLPERKAEKCNLFLTGLDNLQYATVFELTTDLQKKEEGNNIVLFYEGKASLPKEALNKTVSAKAIVPGLNIFFVRNEQFKIKADSKLTFEEDQKGSGQKKSMSLLTSVILIAVALLLGTGIGFGISYLLNRQNPNETQQNEYPQNNSGELPSVNETTVESAETMPRAGSTPFEHDPESVGPADAIEEAATVTEEPVVETEKTTTSPAQPDGISEALKKEYNDKLTAIRKTSFSFDKIDEYKAFLKNKEITEYDKKQSKKDKLSFQIEVANAVKLALESNSTSAASIKQKIGKYASDQSVPQPIRAAICAIYLGNYQDKDNKIDYDKDQVTLALSLSPSCKSYDDMLAIIGQVLGN